MFGEIVKDQIRLNNAGFMVEKWWQKVTNKFPSVQTDEYVVMPNHFHGIINIVGATPCGRPDANLVDGKFVGATPCGRPDANLVDGKFVGATPCGRPDANLVDGKFVGATPCGRPDVCGSPNNKLGQSHRIAPTLGDIVNWFKTMTTNQYIRGVKKNGWPPFPNRLWQRNYYEHIIRNEDELNRFRRYIADNPANWQTDEENVGATLRGRPDANLVDGKFVGATPCGRPNP